MKSFCILVVGIVCTVIFFKWDTIKEKLAESTSSFSTQSQSTSSTTYPPKKNNFTEEEVLELANAWQNGGKRRCVERLNSMKTAFDSKISCPAYHYVKSLASEVRTAIINYEHAIGHDDYRNAEWFDGVATDALRRFEMNCRWKAGVSRGDGTHSGRVEGTWEPDSGRVIVNGRAVKAFRCKYCSGYGQVRSIEVCPTCNGRGLVPNPASQVTDTINLGAGIVSMFGKGGGNIRTPNVPRENRCNSCNGQGRIQVMNACPQCGGKGEIYEP